MLTVGQETHTYTWIDNWVTIPDSISARRNGRTLGIVHTDSNHIVVYNQADPGILIYDLQGQLLSSWGDRFSGAHSITYTNENGQDIFWLTDENSCEVVKTNAQGQTLLNIEPPDHIAYQGGTAYIPTSVAIFDERFGGNGDIFVADGYGASLIHQYDKFGNHIKSLTGLEGATGRFACPHGLAIRFDKAEPELYIADRSNERIQVYDLDGKHKRAVPDITHSPCSFTFHDGCTYIPELFTGIKVLDPDDNLIASIGDNEGITTAPGWPNMAGTDFLQPGKFNSPHDLTVDAEGNIYIAEWIIGGRITKLEKLI